MMTLQGFSSFYGILVATFLFISEYRSSQCNASAAFNRVENSIKFSKKFLHPRESQPLVVSYHNVLQSIIDLNIYWKRKEALFLVDSQTGLDDHQTVSYLRKSLPKWKLEIKVVSIGWNLKTQFLELLDIHQSVIVICGPHFTDRIVQAAASAGFFNERYAWIIVNPAIPNILLSTGISSSAQVTLLRPQDQGHWDEVLRSSSTIDILDVFYSLQTHKVEWVQFATWTIYKRLSILESFQAWDISERLRGREIRTAGFTHVPYVSVAGQNEDLRFTGYSVDVMTMILEYFNVMYTTMEVKDHFGTFINGTYTGLIGNIFRKEADVSLNILFMMPSRLEVTKFLAPVTKLDLAMAYRTPQSTILPTTYLLPFSSEVWLLLLLLFIGVSVMRVVVKVVAANQQSFTHTVPTEHIHNKRFRILTGTYFEKDLQDQTVVTSRVLYATLIFTFTIIYIFYTSVFTSFLAYREFKMPIRNLRELIDSREYNAITVKNTKYEDVFRRAQGGLFEDLWRKMRRNEALCIQNSIFLAILRMYEGRNVFLGDGASIIAAMQNNCTISLMRTPYFHEYGHIVTRTDFPFARMFSLRMIRLREGGLLRRLGRIYMTDNRPPCPVEDSSLSFSLEQVQGVFLIMVGGLILSFLVLIIEILTHALMN